VNSEQLPLVNNNEQQATLEACCVLRAQYILRT